MEQDTLTQTAAIPDAAITAAADDDPDDPDSGSESDEGYANVLVRVTNTAPASEGRPHIRFANIELRCRDHQNHLGHLEPRESKDVQIKFLENELPSVHFRVSGVADLDKLFQVRRQNALPDEIVAPLLEQLNIRFKEVGIEETLEKVIDTVAGIRPDMTLADVSARRAQLGQLKPLVTEKRKALEQIFSDYRLTKESPLGMPLSEVVQLLENMENAKFAAMDAAISNTDLESIQAAAHDFQQLQISALRARETIRRRIRPPQP